MSTNQASAQLDRLTASGVVEKVELPDTKRLGFQIAERSVNVWYLMRASRRVRRRLAWLVESLRLSCGPHDLAERGQAWLQLSPENPHVAHTAACIFAARGDWARAAEMARRILTTAEPDYFQANWADVLGFFAEAVRTGRAAEARALLDDAGLSERLEPLVIALEIAAEGSPARLGRLAPEFAAAVRLALEKIAPDVLAGA